MGSNKDFAATAEKFGDLHKLAETADSMGAHDTAQAYREEASQVRQDFFGPDPKR